MFTAKGAVMGEEIHTPIEGAVPSFSIKVKVADSLRPHGLSMEFSRPEYWSG